MTPAAGPRNTGTGSGRIARRGWRGRVQAAVPAVLAAASLALGGCQNLVAESGTYYNAGLADSFNSLLLVNIVRASKGLPTYYSAIGDYSGGRTAEAHPGISGSIGVNPSGPGTVGVSFGPVQTRTRTANVTSLETKDFIQSMHTPLSPHALVFLGQGNGFPQGNLVIALIVESIALPVSEYAGVVNDAIASCGGDYVLLSEAERGICNNFATIHADAACAGPIGGAAAMVVLRNDPTNPCAYARFRLFVEAATVERPRVALDKAGNIFVSLGQPPDVRRLFTAPGSGAVLRSPNAVIQYLGEIVRRRVEGRPIPSLTGRSGRSIPIFIVESGGAASEDADAVTRYRGVTYALPLERGSDEASFSYRALAMVKDLLTLNTTSAQLPKNPAILVSGSN